MSKLKLDLNDIKIESFETDSNKSNSAGTIKAHETCPDVEPGQIPVSYCLPPGYTGLTLCIAETCEGNSCAYTCINTCDEGSGCNWTQMTFMPICT